MNNEIEIKLSKKKLVLMLIGCIVFVTVGIWFIIDPSKFKSPIMHSSTAIFIAGIAGVLFFGFAGFFIFKKLFDNSPGLVINDEGIVDNSSAVAAGKILWNDVVKIKTVKVASQQFVMLTVRDPGLYIDRQSSAIKRKAMKMNFRMYGSPISISANGLQCKFLELESMLNKKFDEVKSIKRDITSSQQ